MDARILFNSLLSEYPPQIKLPKSLVIFGITHIIVRSACPVIMNAL